MPDLVWASFLRVVTTMRCHTMRGGGNGTGRRRVLALLFAGYLAVVAFGVFGPAPGEQVRQAGQGARRVAGEVREVVPAPVTDEEQRRRLKALRSNVSDDHIANVAVFVPFGLLFPLLVPRWRWWTVPAGMAVSGSIELIQAAFLSWRSPTVSDVVANTVGTAIGFSAWLAVWSLGRIRRRGEQAG